MKPSLTLRALFAAVLLAIFPPAARADAPPPPNDNFASRMTLTGQAVSSTPVTIDGATREGLERADTSNQTVWYTWTPTQDGIVTATTAGSDNASYLSVFNGNDLPSLVEIARDGDGVASLTFFVKAGIVYQFSIGTYYSGSTGVAVLNLNNKATTITAPTVIGVPAGGNDNFANAVALPGATVSGLAYPLEGTREGQEPSFTGGQTVWWTWTAPADAQVTINTSGTKYTNKLTVFNGTALANLTRVASDADSPSTVTFPAKAGSTYVVCVGSYYDNIDSAESDSVVNVVTAPLAITAPTVVESLAAANDNYANAQSLGSAPAVAGIGFNADASTESLEPSATGSHTLWWTWAAPADGTLTISAQGTSVYPTIYVFTGDTIGSAVSVGSSFTAANSAVSGPVIAGTVYHFSMGSNNTGTLVLNLNFAPGLSHVSITADAPVLHQSSATAAVFTLTRDGDLSKIVTVSYKESVNVDGVKNVVTGTKKMKAGKASVKLKLGIGGDYSKAALKVSVVAGDGYVIGDAVKAKVTVYGD